MLLLLLRVDKKSTNHLPPRCITTPLRTHATNRLTLLTLDALWFIVVTVVGIVRRGGTTLSKVPKVGLFHEMLFDHFRVVVFGHVGFGQEVAQRFDGGFVQGFGKAHVKGNVEVALDKGIAETGHAFVLNVHYVGQGSSRFLVLGFALDDLAGSGLDDDFAIVQVFDFPLSELGEANK